MPNTVRFNTSRRQILQTFTARTFYPTMYAKDIPYGARTTAYSGSDAKTAQAVGALVGSVASTAAGAAVDIYGTRAEQEAKTAAERAAARRATATEKTVAAISTAVPWVVGGAVIVAALVFLSKRGA